MEVRLSFRGGVGVKAEIIASDFLPGQVGQGLSTKGAPAVAEENQKDWCGRGKICERNAVLRSYFTQQWFQSFGCASCL